MNITDTISNTARSVIPMDLQIRGAGDLLGKQQHGFIAAVGFDLYCRMLRQAVEEQ